MELILKAFEQLRNPYPEGIQEACSLLERFYQQPDAISNLIPVLTGHPDPYYRKSAIIGIKLCLFDRWEFYSMDEQASLFQMLIQHSFQESDFVVRNILLQLLHKIMNPHFSEMIFQLIQQNFSSILICLHLGGLLCRIPQISVIESIQELIIQLLSAGFQNPSLQVRLSAVQFLVDVSKGDRIPNFLDFWYLSIQLIDECLNFPCELESLIHFLNQIIENVPEIINPEEITSKLFQLFYEKSFPPIVRQNLFSLLETLCSTFKEYFLSSELFIRVIHLSMTLYYSNISIENLNLDYYEDPLPLFDTLLIDLTQLHIPLVTLL